jgi:hypothetical protein
MVLKGVLGADVGRAIMGLMLCFFAGKNESNMMLVSNARRGNQ